MIIRGISQRQQSIFDVIVAKNVLVACINPHVSLDEVPPYLALSYTWGDSSQKGRVLVGDTLLHVTKNLEAALIPLTPEDEPLTLWMDCLSIDRENAVEKPEKVQQMRQTYT
ncbi:heterokaryon incompatibility protein-domain-containing protein [Ilyonectria sp. MPI-CAGE-AT-0026]|nr:heterokaryon incompatibility protein-domain-containing protein [Ilyonectria sp. MPI-CAGE-AT-0026]